MDDIVPGPGLTVLAEVGGDAVASLRFEKPGLVLTEPGAAFVKAGLTLIGLTLVGGLEQMGGWGTDFPLVTLADSDCRGNSDKRQECDHC